MSKHNTRTWSFEDDNKKINNHTEVKKTNTEAKNKDFEAKNDVLVPQKTKSKNFNFRNENPPGTIIPQNNNKKNKKNNNNFNNTLNYGELMILRELAQSKDELFKVIDYFKKIDSNEIEINAIPDTLVIDPEQFNNSTIIPKTFKVYSGVLTELQSFCSQYNNHKVQDIVSFLLLDGIKRYSKDM